MSSPIRRFFYDTEFLEDGKTIDLISIGIVSEEGDTYYAVNADADWARIDSDPWLMENVFPSLPDVTSWIPKEQIALEVLEFLVQDKWHLPELWADYAAYDHVALCQLWGKMIDLPEGIPMWTHDFEQELERRGLKGIMRKLDAIPRDMTEHNALDDAKWLKEQHDMIRWVS